ncbi:MAG: hypothetical protein WAQ25_04120 [Candidatus Saccharimonas sp.]
MTAPLHHRVRHIEERNQRVEFDKAWESSWTRKVCIATLTYVVVWLYLYFVVHVDPWINALVPTIGFLLSTLTLGWVKGQWIRRHDVKKDS